MIAQPTLQSSHLTIHSLALALATRTTMWSRRALAPSTTALLRSRTPSAALSGAAPQRIAYARFSTAATTGSSSTSAAAATTTTTADPLDHSSNYQLVIVGTGWAGYQMFSNCKKYRADIELAVGRPVDIVVVSKRNVRLFLLAYDRSTSADALLLFASCALLALSVHAAAREHDGRDARVPVDH